MTDTAGSKPLAKARRRGLNKLSGLRNVLVAAKRLAFRLALMSSEPASWAG